MDRKSLSIQWGFHKYPFETFIAEQEKDLDSYFIEPPYFQDILGNPDNPISSIVFGRRGDGKTAIFNMLLHNMKNDSSHNPFVVEYTDFSAWTSKEVKQATLDLHLEKILGLAVDILLREIEQNPEIIDKFTDDELSRLQWYILRFLPRAEHSQIENRLNNIFDLKKKSKKILHIGGKGYRRLISLLRRKRFDLEYFSDSESTIAQGFKAIIIILAPSMPGGKDLQNETMLSIFNKFRELVLSADFSSIYILIDKVDETGVTSGDFRLTASLISPIIKSINFLEIDKVATKFFLPNWTREFLGSDLRTDRILTRDTSWNLNRLERMLQERLSAFSDEKITSLEPFVDPNVWPTFMKKIFFYSAMSPRNLLRLLDHIIAELCEIEEEPSIITQVGLDSGIKHFQNIRLRELDSKEYTDRLRDLEKEDFFS